MACTFCGEDKPTVPVGPVVGVDVCADCVLEARRSGLLEMAGQVMQSEKAQAFLTKASLVLRRTKVAAAFIPAKGATAPDLLRAVRLAMLVK